MTVLFTGTKVEDFGGNATQTTNTAYFDSRFVSEACDLALNKMIGVALPTSYTDIWISWCEYVYGTLNTATDGSKVMVLGDTGHYIVLQDGDNGNIAFNVSTTGTNSVRAGPRPFDYIGAVNRYDMHIQFNDAGSGRLLVDIWRNNRKITTEDRALSSHPSAGVQYVEFHNNDWGSFVVSEVIVATEDTRGLRMSPMNADAAGNYSAWDNDYTAFGGHSSGQGITCNVNGDRESWSVSAYGGPSNPAGIHSVNLVASAYKSPTGIQNVDGFLRLGGVDYDKGVNVSPTNGHQACWSWSLNPADSSPWETTDLVTGNEAGVKGVT